MKPRHALASGAIVAVVATGVLAQESLDVVEVLRQARRFSYQVREGRFDVVPAAVTLLQDATAKRPESAALWSALSNAYFLQATAAGQPGQDATQAFGAIARASAAADRALAIEPDHPDALSNQGAALILRSLLEGRPELAPQGLSALDRAVALAPAANGPRLARAFFAINLPPPLRKTDGVADDLRALQRVAAGTRAGDMLHILLGDLLAEARRLDEARREYERAAASESKSVDMARGRLAALDRGAVPASEIAALRGNLGTGCVMCHAR